MPHYLELATSAADVLTGRWYTRDAPRWWIPQDYWKAPTIALELATYMQIAETDAYLDICDATRAAGQGYLTWCAYLDDATVWGRFESVTYGWLSSISHRGADAYLQDATTVYRDLIAQWNSECGGGLYWARSGGGKAMNSTLGLMEIALRLHATADVTDGLEWGKRAWAWIEGTGLITEDGMVWGGLTPTCERNEDNVPVVALQGNPLAPIWSLYAATGDATLLDTANRIVDATKKNFTWPGTSILRTPVDGEWKDMNPDERHGHLNQTLFKGIFIGFLGEYTANLAQVKGYEEKVAEYTAFITENADALAANYPAGIYGMDWHTADEGYQGDSDDQINACLQFSALAAFDAAARTAER